MFQNEELKNHLAKSYTVSSKSAVVAEWNMNVPGNFQKIGNYRYRPSGTEFSALPNIFDITDFGGYYTGATDSDVTIDYGLEEDATTPLLFTYPRDKEKLYYSLEDCLKPFRPRSGINKASYFTNKYLPHPNIDMYLRPRYYMPTRDDEFKYWRSYRIESNTQRTVTRVLSNTGIIDSVSGSGPWTVSISGLTSVPQLTTGQTIEVTASPNEQIFFGTGTVSNISGSGPWTAKLTLTGGNASVAGILVGDIITGESNTDAGTPGNLFGGTPTSVKVVSIINTSVEKSITYTVTGGTTPTAGAVKNLRTVPGALGIGQATIQAITGTGTVTALVDNSVGTTAPIIGSLRSISIQIFETNLEYGISQNRISGPYPIEDCAPFVVYKEPVPANRLITKVQTNIGSKSLGTFKGLGGISLSDPFFGDANKTVPVRFRLQYLTENNEWQDAYVFDETSLRQDGASPIFDADGYLSLEYGLQIPEGYETTFVLIDKITDISMLPERDLIGHAYLLVQNENEIGTLKVFNGETFDDYLPRYGWSIGTNDVNERTNLLTDFTNPDYYLESNSIVPVYRQFAWIKGIRLFVESMNTPNTPLELIELSPRLVANITEKVSSYDITKNLADLSSSALPVSQLLASTGTVVIFDGDQSFNINNKWDFVERTGSIVAKYVTKNVKFDFYEIIQNVNGSTYYVPFKKLYGEGLPQTNQAAGTLTITLKDFYFHFESMPAPSILLTEVSLSQAVCILLDSIGFSNYVFKRLTNEKDPIIPYFFVAPEQNVAEVLSQLAVATQSAMFFDEYNNFVVMSKQYLLDDTGERSIDIELLGQDMLVDQDGNKYPLIDNVYNVSTLPLSKVDGAFYNYADNGIYVWSDLDLQWQRVGFKADIIPANIADIASQDQKVYNAGTINYTARYIQRSYGSLNQARQVDKTWIYKPVLLWEVAGTEKTTSANSEKQSKYALAAMPLNTDLDNQVPFVSGHQIVNNIIDVGENAYFVTRFQGYLYANGEVIRYDAVEYSVSGVGTVWISDNLEYQKYFADLKFNGKIYPTGLLRIYAEPFYETIEGITKLKNGAVVSHGRGQFGTPVISHPAGLDAHWASNDNVQGIDMLSQYLYTSDVDIENKLPGITYNVAAGLSQSRAQRSTRSGVIKNFLSSAYSTETDVARLKTTATGTIQSSALVMNGPELGTGQNPRDFVSYVHKPISGPYKHFGTRMRIIGKVETVGDKSQTPVGGMTYYNIPGIDPTQTISLGGGSGGIGLVNPQTNSGYFFEISALTGSNLEKYLKPDPTSGEPTVSLNNVMFYKVGRATYSGTVAITGSGSSGTYRVTGITNTTGLNVGDILTKISGTGAFGGGAATITEINGNTITLVPASFSAGNIAGSIIFSNNKAIPKKLWGGIANIIVDDGNFTGQYRFTGETNPTVYDLSMEYVDVNPSTRVFYLYINQKLVKVVRETSDLISITNPHIGLFIRGTSRVMFENVYALAKNYASNAVFDINTPIASVFSTEDNIQINASEALNKYALSGVIQKTYLSGIRPNTTPDYAMYFEEFGTIMREAAYFNIKYDRAFPALYSKIAPTFNRLRGYTVSGFTADSYGAEFLVFNATDTILNLDETSGNYLRILGVAFTQDTTNSITADDFLKRRGNFADPELKGLEVVQSPQRSTEQYEQLRISRLLYGKNEFSLESPYIQDQDTAEDLLQWLIEKNLRPRKAVGLNMFSTPTLQLGDFVNINYKNNEGIDIVSDPSKKFVVYNITYNKSTDGPNMTVYLSEV